MLTNLRERSQQSFGVLILFGMLTFIFIFFFGPQSEGCQPQRQVASLDGWAARVNEVELTRREVENLVYLRSDRLSEEQLVSTRRQVLERLIDEELMAQKAVANGIDIDEDGLTRYITTDENPDFRAFTNDDGLFDPKIFRDALRYRLGISPDAYRERKKREVLADQYRRLLEVQVSVSDKEVEAEIKAASRQWTLDFLRFSPTDYPEAQGTAEEIAEFSATNEEKLKAFYDANKTKRFVKGREVRARRILIKKPADKEGIASAKVEIEKLYAQAKAPGANFEELAKAHSQGAGDQAKSGDMGFIKPGAAYYKEVFEPLKVGEISAIQDKPIGFFFVKAIEETPAINKTLDDVKMMIAKELLVLGRQEAQAKANAEQALAALKDGTTMEALVKTDVQETGGDSVVDAADLSTIKPIKGSTGAIADQARFGQPWDRIPGMGKTGRGVTSPELARALRKLTEQQPLLGKVMKIDGEFYVVRLNEFKEADEATIAEQLPSKKVELLRKRRTQLIYGENIGFGGDPLASFRKVLRNGQSIEINAELYPQPATSSTGLPANLQLNL